MVDFERKPIFVARTPWDKVPEVTLFADTWHEHIVKSHVQMAGKEPEVQTVASNPTFILQGTSNLGHVIYINETVTSQSGTPLAVIINPEQKIIVSAYYNRSLKVITPDQVIWSP
jgi:hypothetical protein